MNWFLIVLYLAAAAGCLWIALSYKERKLSVPATNPKEDRLYWEMMTGKFQKGFYVGSAGGLISAVGIALKYPLVAEIGCITLMAAMVFNLAFLCRKLAFRPSAETEALQKKWKLLLLGTSFLALFLTQAVFQYFLNIQ